MNETSKREQLVSSLASCPFCGGGEYRIDEFTHWTGTRSEVISARVTHWCQRQEGQPQSTIQITGKTAEHAVENWNKRINIAPIERDESCDRTYIPMPGGWEVQTKGTGSTFRIYDGNEDFRLPVFEQPYLFDMIERMAKATHAEVTRLESEVARLQRLLDETPNAGAKAPPADTGG